MPPLFENEFIRQGILFEDASNYRLPCAQTGTGVMDVQEVLRRVKEDTGWKQHVLAKKAGSTQGTISKWMSGEQSPNKTKWDKILDLIRREPKLSDLRIELGLHGTSGGDIPVMGRIGAGANIDPDMEQVPPEGLYQVALPFAMPDDAIAFEVIGESMLPVYDDGEVIVVTRDQSQNVEAFVGELCAIRTADGRRFLKQLMPGSRPGLYRLESFNAKPVQDVEVEWIGEILATIPARKVSRIAPRVSSAKKRAAGGRRTK